MKPAVRMTLLILLTMASLVSGYGQSSQDSQEEPVVVSTNLVTVNIIVTDSKGRYVKGLKSEQFSIYDESAKQKTAHFSVGAAPVSIGIVCEIHPKTADRVAAVLSALKQFVATLGPSDTFSLQRTA